MGGLGLAPSANIGEKGCYFEPVHGSAPNIQENCANPSAMFLTIALLLEHFGFNAESKRIKDAVQQVIKEGRFLTYDLGGNTSTQAMANIIIERCMHPKDRKTISFLGTGNELIQGDVLDTNSNYFAKEINKNGGNIYQHLQVSDKKHEIVAALRYLFARSDAVIITGGLGPTSDDTTRFALADAIDSKLYFSETAWLHVKNRLKRFNLEINDANRQQALFPLNAELYHNELGTAFGCYLKWQNKHIFMLPGPPKECRPLFQRYVVVKLMEAGFLSQKKMVKWLTLGLIEGEIASEIDTIASANVETSYRWDYPYLEIKLIYDINENIESLVKQIETLISPNVVSYGRSPFEELNVLLDNFPKKIFLVDKVTIGQLVKKIFHSKLIASESEENIKDNELSFFALASRKFQNPLAFEGSITFMCLGFMGNKKIYRHKISVPNRGPEIIHFAQGYIAWQLIKFIKCIGYNP
jgi:isocitrate dehydrogenase